MERKRLNETTDLLRQIAADFKLQTGLNLVAVAVWSSVEGDAELAESLGGWLKIPSALLEQAASHILIAALERMEAEYCACAPCAERMGRMRDAIAALDRGEVEAPQVKH